MFFWAFLQILLWAQAFAVSDDTKPGCPEPVDINSCACYNIPYPVLKCHDIVDSFVASEVFENYLDYGYEQVHIESFVLQSLEADLFERMTVRKLFVKNSVLILLFDRAPESIKDLDTLHIENTLIKNGLRWSVLEAANNLRILNVHLTRIRSLGTDFSNYVTTELKEISFNATSTKDIKPGTFRKFVNLEKVAFESNQLTTLSRDIFPRPFNVRYMLFNNNKLSTIPDDMFIDMPMLRTVGLKHNAITTISIPRQQFPAYLGSILSLDSFQLDGNPLVCDCSYKWYVDFKPSAVSGTCYIPIELRGQDLKHLNLDYCMDPTYDTRV